MSFGRECGLYIGTRYQGQKAVAEQALSAPGKQEHVAGNLRGPANRQTDWPSIYLTCLLIGFAGLNMTIYATSLWPYTTWVTKQADVAWLGYALAGTSLGSILADPLFGWWQQKTNSKPPLLFGFAVTLIGNILYALLPIFPEAAILYVLVISRIFLGFSSSAIGLLRTFVSMNTLEKDRLLGTAALSIGLTLGLSLGPVVQMAAIPLGEEGFTLFGILMDQYTVPAILMSILCIVNLIIIQFYLHENFAGFAGEIGDDGEAKEDPSLPPYDKVALGVLFYIWCLMMTASASEYTHEVITKHGILQSVQCVLSAIAAILLMKTRIRNIDNRIQLSFALCLFLFASLFLFPWPFFEPAQDFPVPPGQNPHQCDAACLKRRVPMWLYFFSLAFCYGPAASIGVTVTNSLATLVVGPRKQALIQGWMTAAGSLSSFLWPLGATEAFKMDGMRTISLANTSFYLIGLVLIVFYRKRLLPLVIPGRSMDFAA
ncbi:unnamed protein product, partial [Mesorhabditis spiculigera]